MEEFFHLLEQLSDSKNVKKVMGHYKNWIKDLPTRVINEFARVLPHRIEEIRDPRHLLHILYLVHDTLMRIKPSSLDQQLWSTVMEMLVPQYCQLAGASRDKENLRKMHGNWKKIRVFDNGLLGKLAASIEGYSGKRGREGEEAEESQHLPERKLAKAGTDAAAKANMEVGVFRGSEVLHKVDRYLRLPHRTRLCAFYIYHLVMASTTLPTEVRDAPAAAMAALLLACKIRDTYVPLERLIEAYEDQVPHHLKALHARHCLRERILRIESRAVCLLGFDFDLPDPMAALEYQWAELQVSAKVRQRCVDIAHSRPYLYSSIIHKFEAAVVAASVLVVAVEIERKPMPEGWAQNIGVNAEHVQEGAALLKEWAGCGKEDGKLVELSTRADPFQHRESGTPAASVSGSSPTLSRDEHAGSPRSSTPQILQQLLNPSTTVPIQDLLPTR